LLAATTSNAGQIAIASVDSGFFTRRAYKSQQPSTWRAQMLVTTRTPAARNITIAVAQPRTLVTRPFVRLPMIFRLFATTMIMTRSGGATKPLMTAVARLALSAARRACSRALVSASCEA
jgi:hypothetical protein